MPLISSIATAAITQVMLAHHREFREQIQCLSQHSVASREQLLYLQGVGAVVELGPLNLRVVVQHHRPLSEANLIPIIGQDNFDFLKSRVTPTVTCQVKVIDA